MTIHPCLLPTLLVAAASTVAAAFLRRAVRKEYASLAPWLWPWGAICAVPALLYAALCLPGFVEAAARLNESMRGSRAELLAGAAGVLTGLILDWTAERTEQRRTFPFGLPAAAVHAISIAALLLVLLIPYAWLFELETPSAQTDPERTEATASPETVPAEASPAEAESGESARDVASPEHP